MSNKRHCPHCHCSMTIKFGRRKGRQRYRCKACKAVWSSMERPNRVYKLLWSDFVFRGYRVVDLADKYNLSKTTIRKILDEYVVPPIIPSLDDHSVIAMDCTYFGREYGLLIVIDAHTGDCLYYQEIGNYETIMDYQRAIICLRDKCHIYPKACVIDGKKGMYSMLEYYQIKPQFCQFHQLQIINKYLTKKPVLEPNIELRQIALSLTHVDHETFYNMFNSWRWRHQVWLREKTYNPETRRREYTHQDTRKAARSLLVNMPYLFTFDHNPEPNIPNTNNMLEGVNSVIKDKLKRHRGLHKSLKLKLIRSFLSDRTEVNNNH